MPLSLLPAFGPGWRETPDLALSFFFSLGLEPSFGGTGIGRPLGVCGCCLLGSRPHFWAGPGLPLEAVWCTLPALHPAARPPSGMMLSPTPPTPTPTPRPWDDVSVAGGDIALAISQHLLLAHTASQLSFPASFVPPPPPPRGLGRQPAPPRAPLPRGRKEEVTVSKTATSKRDKTFSGAAERPVAAS